MMFIPGFRSNNKLKMAVAILYYIASLFMITEGIGYTLCLLALPFAIFSGIDLKKRKSKGSKLILVISCLILIISSMLIPDKQDDNNLALGSVSPSAQAESTETSTPTPYSSQAPMGEHEEYTNDVITPGAGAPDAGNNSVEAPKSGNGNINTSLSGKLEANFIDVGQADSILIIQNNAAMLIDGGNNADSDLVKDFLKEKGIKRLDYVIGTHPHEDHIGGLDVVIKSFDIGKVIMPKAESTTKTFEDLLKAIQDKNLRITTPVPGTEYTLGDARFMILAPNSSKYDDLNNHSVVIKLTFGNNSFLFTGDAEDISENEIIAGKYDIKSDVLKVGHHGSDSSTTSSFLKKVSPRYAVISVGQGNSYGHPTEKVLNRLKQNGITVYRTDISGTITAISDGKDISFSFHKNGIHQNPKPLPSQVPTPKPSNSSTPKPTPTPTPVPSPTPDNLDKIVIEKVDLVGELVVIRNKGSSDVNLTGWKLLSVTGNQTFYFPDGCIIKAGSTLSIASGDTPGDLKWGRKNIWNNKGDRAELYDDSGKLISSK